MRGLHESFNQQEDCIWPPSLAEEVKAHFDSRGTFKDWRPQGAITLPEVWFYVNYHRPSGMLLNKSLIVAIFFEETTCCNMIHLGTAAAIGPGHNELRNDLIPDPAGSDQLRENRATEVHEPLSAGRKPVLEGGRRSNRGK